MLFGALTLTLLWCAASQARVPAPLAQLAISDVAFVHLLRSASGRADLVATSFAPLENGTVSVVRDVGGALRAGGARVRVDVAVGPAFGLQWPNELTTSRTPGRVLLGDGFLLPGQETGQIVAVDVLDSGLYRAERFGKPESDWFYHKAFEVDVNNDGLLDVVTARAKTGTFGGGQGELVWLEAPSYALHTIASGPDINIDVLRLNGTAAPFVVFAAEFFGEQLTSFRIGSGGTVLKRTVIEKSIGKVYAAVVADLRNTGKPSELVVTNYRYFGGGSMFIYPLDDLSKRQTVYDKFHNVQWMPGSGAPGFVYPHFARARPKAGECANIFVAGDGAQHGYFFTPTQCSAAGVSYKLAVDKNYDDTVGGACVGDIDGDGWNEVFLTVYEKGQVVVETYAPSLSSFTFSPAE